MAPSNSKMREANAWRMSAAGIGAHRSDTGEAFKSEFGACSSVIVNLYLFHVGVWLCGSPAKFVEALLNRVWLWLSLRAHFRIGKE